MQVKNKIALVTGAAKGIGAECALKLAREGAAAVIVVDIDDVKSNETVSRIDSFCRAEFRNVDVSKEEQVLKVIESVEMDFDRLDILLNIAGITSTRTIFQEDMAGWDRIIDINLKGSFLFTREAFKLMKKQQYGRIVNISSISGQVGGIRTSPAYAASKAGILSLTKSFAKLGAADNITVNAVAPGLIDTGMTRGADFHYSLEEIPMRRVGKPEDVADAVLFLASDASSYITGQCLNVNGGMYMV